MRLVAIGDPLPERPGEALGIKMLVMLPGELGIHELATTATGVIGALYDLFEATSSRARVGRGRPDTGSQALRLEKGEDEEGQACHSTVRDYWLEGTS